MSKEPIKIAVTGASGQIAYSLLFRIANGDLFGKDQPIILNIYDLKEPCEKVLPGLKMELDDCSFPLLEKVNITSELQVAFDSIQAAILLGAKPRLPGMERKDLLLDNGKIFVGQGKALNDYASKDVKVLVVGNPCNTNCLIALSHAPDLPKDAFHAMTRLDQNRALFQIAQKSNVSPTDVSNVVIWGNHSATQVPDFTHAQVHEKPVFEYVSDRAWLENDFLELVQKRGSAVLAKRGKSSAASAAQAVIDAMKSIFGISERKDWFSSAIYTQKAKNHAYEVADGIVFSFPCLHKGGKVSVVENLPWDAFIAEKIALTEKELLQERDMVAHLLG